MKSLRKSLLKSPENTKPMYFGKYIFISMKLVCTCNRKKLPRISLIFTVHATIFPGGAKIFLTSLPCDQVDLHKTLPLSSPWKYTRINLPIRLKETS